MSENVLENTMSHQQNHCSKLNLNPTQGILSRRSFLTTMVGASAFLAATPSQALASFRPLEPRVLSLNNLHTGEKLVSTYWADGEYLPDSLADIDHLLRDHRRDEVATIDPKLLDFLHGVQRKMDAKGRFEVISGYRSPQTNESLRASTSGVAKKSFHMRGMAIDVRMPGQDLTHFRKAAMAMRAGGVGYYPKSNFLHLDVGRVRSWG